MNLFKKLVVLVLLSFGLFNVSAEIYRKNGVVSFYAEDFHGKRTSNGETFNMYELTCASKTLPFDTQLKVTNLKNGKSVIVRVNDRGPFVIDRDLDLSKAAAIQLGMVSAGTANVQIEIIKLGPNSNISKETAEAADKIMTRKYGADWNKDKTPEPKPSTTTTTTNSTTKKSIASAPEGSIFEIQIASFNKKENAQKCAKKLSSLGFKNIFIRNSGDTYKVMLKGIPKKDVVKVEKKLQENGFKGFIIRLQQ